MPSIPDYIIKNFTSGVITRIESEAIPKGAASDSLNWLTAGDHIELRRGQAVMGTSIAGAGRVTGLRVAQKLDSLGTEVLIYTYARKALYYDDTTEAFIEIGSDMLPAAASGEDIAIEKYYSQAGAFFYLSSPNSGVYKIPTANPGSSVDLQMTAYRGKIKAKKNTFFLWDRKDTNGGSDKTGLYRSWLDKVELSDYPFVGYAASGGTGGELSATAGNGAITQITGTLAQINKATAANVKRTCHYLRIGLPIGTAKAITGITAASAAVVTCTGHGLSVGDFTVFEGVVGMVEINGLIGLVSAVGDADHFTVAINSTSFTPYSSDGTSTKAEVLVDQRDGTLTGNTTGTGTINYATGAYVANAPSAITNTKHSAIEYYYEDATNADSGASNSGAPLDFSYSATRLAGEGISLRQDDGGYAIQNLFTLGSDEYAFHSEKTWKVAITADDETEISNQLFRAKMGISYWRGAAETSVGIVFADTNDINEAFIRTLQISDVTGLALPKTLSDRVDLSPFRFDKDVVFEYGQLIIIACRLESSTVNDRALVYNKLWKSIDILDWRISCAESYNGTLVAGDSGSNNVFKLFDGFYDEEAEIPNSWTSGNDALGAEGVKRCHRCLLAGLIGVDQSFDFQISLDNGDFVTVATISGTDSFVDTSSVALIGSGVLGTGPIGGGETEVEAFRFRHEFSISLDRFEKLRYRFVATAGGWLSISEVQFKDMRYKGRRAATRYVSEPGT